MRVSPGDLRQGIIDPTFAIPKDKPTVATPHSILTKAVRVFHEEGVEAADRYVIGAFEKPTWKSPRTRTKARNAIASFENYKTMAMGDPRPVAIGDQRATVHVAGHQVSAGYNVVVLDDAGVAGRYCVWSIIERPFANHELALLTCPIVLALGEELGEERVLGVDFWFLRTNTRAHVSAEAAVGALPDLNRIVRRLTINA